MGGLLGIKSLKINKVENSNGAGILSSAKTGLVFAIDMSDMSKYMLYSFFKNYTGSGGGSGSIASKTVVLASSGLSLGASNIQGTQVVNGGTDIQQWMIGFS